MKYQHNIDLACWKLLNYYSMTRLIPHLLIYLFRITSPILTFAIQISFMSSFLGFGICVWLGLELDFIISILETWINFRLWVASLCSLELFMSGPASLHFWLVCNLCTFFKLPCGNHGSSSFYSAIFFSFSNCFDLSFLVRSTSCAVIDRLFFWGAIVLYSYSQTVAHECRHTQLV